jgi:hypothetical protein
MDPFLEQRGLWEEVRTRLVIAIAAFLTPLVAPRYQVALKTLLAMSAIVGA